MPVIGTAGHVDHGKSTLVLALTGRDPDRLSEEKERGLTIDLGFAWTDLGTGSETGFIDVPGHERFIKNMLAGVGALDVALFVVAADSGWMPQSEEHLAVLDLLGVRHGVIALTRIDLVDADLIELAQLEIQDRVADTGLEGWPIVPVSPISGAGIGDVRRALAAELTAAGDPRDLGRPRLWVDRSFHISGAGVVVTGTLVDGTLAVEDRLAVFPGESLGRVRSLQSHERAHDRLGPGTRAAVNLAGLDRADLGRGAMLGMPHDWPTTDRILVGLRPARGHAEALTDRGAYHVHLGTASTPARIRIVGADEPGPVIFALVTLSARVPTVMGDRFVLRETGRKMVVGGGRVLDPAPPERLSGIALAPLWEAVDQPADDRADALLAVHGRWETSALFVNSGGGSAKRAVVAGSETLAPETAATMVERLVELTDRYHREHPLRGGIPKGTLASATGVDLATLEVLLETAGKRFIDDGALVRSPQFDIRLSAADAEAWQRAAGSLREGLAVPRASQMGLHAELLHALCRSGDLVRIDSDLVYLPEQIDQITSGLSNLPAEFTVAVFRDAYDLTRRQAVPLLEWLDASNYTRRRGDVRVVRRRTEPPPDAAPPP